MPRANPDVNYEISIHALLAESDRSLLLPVRGSRISIHALLAESDGFGERACRRAGISIHVLLAESDVGDTPPCCGCMISIHALLAESDCWCWEPGTVTARFLSTLSLRRATRRFFRILAMNNYFYPRSPCGERRKLQSVFPLADGISIHALLAESDRLLGDAHMPTQDFYPRSPCGERPVDTMP